jgi:hypothetical protein
MEALKLPLTPETHKAFALTLKALRDNIKNMKEQEETYTSELFLMGTELPGVYKFIECNRADKIDYKSVLITLADNYGIPKAEIDAVVKMFSTPQKSYLQCKFV